MNSNNDMLEKKKSLFIVASGQLENPSIELEVDGEVQRFTGKDDKVFAFGMLAGLKAAKDDFSMQLNIKTE